MKRCAHIVNGLVAEVFPTILEIDGKDFPLEDRFHPDFVAQLVSIPEGQSAAAGWTYDGQSFAAPIAIAPVEVAPQVVSQRQGRLALLNAGIYQQVLGLIAGISDPADKMRAQIEWDAPTYERRSEFLIDMATQLGLDSEALDQLFTAAAAL